MGGKFGFSWSWKRTSGLSGMKGKISRQIGIPLTRSGRERKLGRLLLGGSLPVIGGRSASASATGGTSMVIGTCPYCKKRKGVRK